MVRYRDLFLGRRFRVKGNKSVFVKIANSHAVNEETETDAIFALGELCAPCGNNKALLHKVTSNEEKLFSAS